MYPILTTERLALKPLAKDDFDDMFAIRSNKDLCAAMVRTLQKNPDNYRVEFTQGLQNGTFFTIRQKDDNNFIGYIEADKIRNSGKARTISSVGLYIVLLPEYWGNGYATEALQKAIHFAFMGIKTPFVYANIYVDNPVAVKFFQKLGLTYHSSNSKSVQYRYTKDDYISNYALTKADEDVYDYRLRNSPYSYDNPLRAINGVKYPNDVNVALCGQSVIAMLTGLSVAEVADVMYVDTPGQEVTPSYMEYTLDYYGIKSKGGWAKRVAINADTILPDICILLMNVPGKWNYFSLYYKGVYYDPKVGVVEKLPDSVKPVSYIWEIAE